MKIYLIIFLISFSLGLKADILADEIEQLVLLSERPVSGMVYGNFSGLTKCRGNYYAVSDKDDKNIYKLSMLETKILAKKVRLPYFEVKFSIINYLKSLLKLSSNLDLEAISCDNQGNLYIASEEYSQILKVDKNNIASWIKYPPNFLDGIQKKGLLVKENAKLEGVAVDDEGKNLWLIAERNNRGIIKLTNKNNNWLCEGDCILINENFQVKPNLLGRGYLDNDFSDAIWYKGKIFTLERSLHLVCRRNSDNGLLEKCWSFSKSVLAKTYPFYKYGMAEALFIDKDNTLLIGIDNNYLPREDGEMRPIVFHFKPPRKDWFN